MHIIMGIIIFLATVCLMTKCNNYFDRQKAINRMKWEVFLDDCLKKTTYDDCRERYARDLPITDFKKRTIKKKW